MCLHPFFSEEFFIRHIVYYSSRAESRTGMAWMPSSKDKWARPYSLANSEVPRSQADQNISWKWQIRLRNFIGKTELWNSNWIQLGFTAASEYKSSVLLLLKRCPPPLGLLMVFPQYFSFWGIVIMGLQWTRCLLLTSVLCWLVFLTAFCEQPCSSSTQPPPFSMYCRLELPCGLIQSKMTVLSPYDRRGGHQCLRECIKMSLFNKKE